MPLPDAWDSLFGDDDPGAGAAPAVATDAIDAALFGRTEPTTPPVPEARESVAPTV